MADLAKPEKCYTSVKYTHNFLCNLPGADACSENIFT